MIQRKDDTDKKDSEADTSAAVIRLKLSKECTITAGCWRYYDWH